MVFNSSSLLWRVSSVKNFPTRIARRTPSSWTVAAPSYGVSTPASKDPSLAILKSPYYLETGYAICPKRPPRPFPPPFLSLPSSSFSDPLTTHDRSQDRRPSVHGELIRGLTNGDDAILVSGNYIGVNDGVGAWAKRPQGHAGLWSRLILHFWALEVESINPGPSHPRTVEFLQRAYEQTVDATTSPNEWFGTTTSVTALLHCRNNGNSPPTPILHVTNLGDCQVMIIRPETEEVIFQTAGQWHWFDCPMQLGTNSVDTPRQNAVLTTVELEEDDIVVAMSDGVTDNLWGHEIARVVLDSLQEQETASENVGKERAMVYAARQLLEASRVIAQDPFAQTPYMEKALEEGLAIEGGKMDDISVVVGRCVRQQIDDGDLALQSESSSPATRDSTIFRSTVSCPECTENNCYKCTLGHDDTLEVNTGGLAFIRALVGFQLSKPSASITACTVQFPAFTQPIPFPVNVTLSKATSPDWSEDTVNGENAPEAEDPFTKVEVAANTNIRLIDITHACKAAATDGQFSIYLGTESGRIEFPSKDSSNPAILHVTDDDDP